MKTDEAVLDHMKAFLDYSARKQQVITSNLANSETPGYRAKELNFEDVFQKELGGISQKLSKQHHYILSRSDSVVRYSERYPPFPK